MLYSIRCSYYRVSILLEKLSENPYRKGNDELRFDDILSRADEQTLQEILGANTIRVLTILDETQAYNKYIKELVINLFGKEGLLLDKKKRMLILDLLRESEAKELVGLLYTSPEYSDLELYSKLKNIISIVAQWTKKSYFVFLI